MLANTKNMKTNNLVFGCQNYTCQKSTNRSGGSISYREIRWRNCTVSPEIVVGYFFSLLLIHSTRMAKRSVRTNFLLDQVKWVVVHFDDNDYAVVKDTENDTLDHPEVCPGIKCMAPWFLDNRPYPATILHVCDTREAALKLKPEKKGKPVKRRVRNAAEEKSKKKQKVEEVVKDIKIQKKSEMKDAETSQMQSKRKLQKYQQSTDNRNGEHGANEGHGEDRESSGVCQHRHLWVTVIEL